MSSRSGSSSNGTSRPSSAMAAVSSVRPNRVWMQSSSATRATCWPSSRASSCPFSVSATGTAGSPLMRFSKFSVDSPWRASTYRCTKPRLSRHPLADAASEESRLGRDSGLTNHLPATTRAADVATLGTSGYMAVMSAQVEELPDNKVRLTVDVPGADVQHAVEHAASDLAASVKIPGFRKGRVPMPVLVSRIGKERLYTEAIESHIGSWYGNAVARTGIRPAEQPELDYDLPGSDRENWRFTATVSVLPKPEVADWTKLQVPYAEPEVPEDIVEHELDALRSTVAQLAPVDGRPTRLGDTVVVDLIAGDGGQRDYVVELGSGRLVPELEEQLVGMAAGET